MSVILQVPVKSLPEFEAYPDLIADLERLESDARVGRLRRWILSDLFFLIRRGLRRYDIEKEWLFQRCREVQAEPDGMLDLWAREHYKSSIITYGLTIQDILNDPEITVGIFSHTRPIAKGFLRQIKREFESNTFLKDLFPDVLYQNPAKEAVKWSEDDGLIVNRQGNPNASTVEAWGLIDGQPTSKHFSLMVYDDVVTKESVSTPEMIKKTTDAWELSLNLTVEGGRARYIGTRYHYNDTYATMIKRGSVKPRIHPAIEYDVPVLLSQETLDKKRRDMGVYTFSCQMLLNPVADDKQGFNPQWFKTYQGTNTGKGLNKLILVDPANEKRKKSDYTVMFVIGLGEDQNYLVLDMVRDRLNLTERVATLFRLHKKWKPGQAGYEKYGMQSDIQHIEDKMSRENYRFDITELGGQMSKPDRIRRLVPLFEQGRILFPETCHKTNYEKKTEDLVSVFLEEEFKAFPVMVHDDMLDCLARITDEDIFIDFPAEDSPRIEQIDPDH